VDGRRGSGCAWKDAHYKWALSEIFRVGTDQFATPKTFLRCVPFCGHDRLLIKGLCTFLISKPLFATSSGLLVGSLFSRAIPSISENWLSMVGVNAIAAALSSEACTLETLWYDCSERKPHHCPRPPLFSSDLRVNRRASLPCQMLIIPLAPDLAVVGVVAIPFPTASI